MPVYIELLSTNTVNESECLGDEVINLLNDPSNVKRNEFRSQVKNSNMDTGYWIDVTMEDDKLKIIWRYTWCKEKE